MLIEDTAHTDTGNCRLKNLLVKPPGESWAVKHGDDDGKCLRHPAKAGCRPLGPFLPYYQSRAAWLMSDRSLRETEGIETLDASLELSSFGVSLTPSPWGLRVGP